MSCCASLSSGSDTGAGSIAKILEVANLRLEMQLMHGESVLHGSDHDDVFLAARDPAADRALLGLAKRRGEECVGLGAALVRCQVIGAVEIHRIDRFERHELADVDGSGWWRPRAP